MPQRLRLPLSLLLILLFVTAGCDTGPAPAPTATPAATTSQASDTPTSSTGEQATPTIAAIETPAAGVETVSGETPTGQAIAQATSVPIDTAAVTPPATPDESAPSPTPVTATSTGAEMTALEALDVLKEKALDWQSDARLGMVANTRPGQQTSLLAGALGSPDVNEPTPGGKGRNWTLVAFSPSANGAMAFSMDGTQVDLVKEGGVDSEVISRFGGADSQASALGSLDTSKLEDSDKLVEQAGDKGKGSDIGLALIAPNGLGLGPLPTPQTGGQSPQLAYELFVQSGAQQSFVLYDATTGAVVLDSTAP